MTDAEFKKLKDDLWHSADMLRASAHLAANKYGQPILGLIFLRYADILFKQHKAEIEAEYARKKGGRAERSIKQISIEKMRLLSPGVRLLRRHQRCAGRCEQGYSRQERDACH